MRFVQLCEVPSYVRCVMGGIQLWEVRSEGRNPVMRSAQSWELPGHVRCPVM